MKTQSLSALDSKGLVDLKDLRELLSYISANAKDISARYGNVAVTSIGAVQRQLLVLENQGAAKFLGEPALKLKDFIGTDRDGRGYINILSADKLMQNPRLYATFLLWLLSELFEELPEVGDPDKPKLCFFFDEAHLLFTDAPKPLLDKIEQVVRLIRSKGVGVYFVTQNPLDVPDKVLAQLGNRVQHALRAFTPRDQKAVKTAAETFRANPKLDTVQGDHGTRKGRGAGLVPRRQRHAVHGRTRHDPPAVGAAGADHAGGAQGDHGQDRPVKGKYDQTVDPEFGLRNSAQTRVGQADPAAPAPGDSAQPAPGAGSPRQRAAAAGSDRSAASSGRFSGRTSSRGPV